MEKIEIRYSIKNLLFKVFGNLVFVLLGFYLLKLTDFQEVKNFKIKDYIMPLVSILFIFFIWKICQN